MVRTLRDEGLDDSDRKLLENIRDHGCGVIHIPEEDGTPGWSFSVGLFQSYQAPEVIVFGLDQDVAHHLVNTIGEWAKAGDLVAEDQLRDELIADFACTFRPVQQQWYAPFVGSACWYYRSTKFPLLQCFWPDRDRQFPWARDFRESWKWAQPLLYNTTRKTARVDALLTSMGE